MTELPPLPLDLMSGFGWRNAVIDVAPPPDEPSLLTLTIELDGSDPLIWRRLSLPGDLTLDAVHLQFQAAMGWTESHLHRFQPGTGQAYNVPYFITDFDEEDGDEGTREDAVRLDQVLRSPGDRLTYLYDFGDGWEHHVTLEAVEALTDANREPVCLDGANACPPEDCGGTHGHHEIATWLRAGAPAEAVPEPFEDAAQAHGWLPTGYHPDAFDADAATEAMRLWARGEHLPWHALPEPLAALVQSLRGEGWWQADAWLSALGPREPVSLADDDVRIAARPWLALLDAVGTGTTLTAAGYLRPAVVEQIAGAAGVTQWWLGTANREDHTWPVATLRKDAQDLGLLRKAKGSLTPTARARAIGGDPRALVSAVLARLPIGKGFEADAGWFALLGLAAGTAGSTLDEGVALCLTDRGWRINGRAGVSARDARTGAEASVEALATMSTRPNVFRDVDPDRVSRLARAALFGMAAI